MSSSPWTAVRSEGAGRAGAAALASAGLLVLVVARALEPAAAGHGTHTQLGLPPCTFLTLTGWACPLCGATTTFSLLAHGRLVEGVLNHPFAALLFLLDVALISVAAAEALVPADRFRRIQSAVERSDPWVSGSFLALMFAGWIYRIAVG